MFPPESCSIDAHFYYSITGCAFSLSIEVRNRSTPNKKESLGAAHLADMQKALAPKLVKLWLEKYSIPPGGVKSLGINCDDGKKTFEILHSRKSFDEEQNVQMGILPPSSAGKPGPQRNGFNLALAVEGP